MPLRPEHVRAVVKQMAIDWDLSTKRESAYASSNENARVFWHWLMDPAQVSDEEIAALGLNRIDKPRPESGMSPGRPDGAVDVAAGRPSLA